MKASQELTLDFQMEWGAVQNKQGVSFFEINKLDRDQKTLRESKKNLILTKWVTFKFQIKKINQISFGGIFFLKINQTTPVYIEVFITHLNQ